MDIFPSFHAKATNTIYCNDIIINSRCLTLILLSIDVYVYMYGVYMYMYMYSTYYVYKHNTYMYSTSHVQLHTPYIQNVHCTIL